MNWYKIFYWLTVADNLKEFFGWVGVVSAVCVVAYTIGLTIANIDPTTYKEGFWDDISKAGKILYFTLLFLAITNIFAWILIPSKKDALIIITGGVVGDFLQSDTSSAKIPADLTRYLHTYLQKEIQELGPEARSELGLKTEKETYLDQLKDLSKEELIRRIQDDPSIRVDSKKEGQ
jgi:hypothetical protein